MEGGEIAILSLEKTEMRWVTKYSSLLSLKESRVLEKWSIGDVQ